MTSESRRKNNYEVKTYVPRLLPNERAWLEAHLDGTLHFIESIEPHRLPFNAEQFSSIDEMIRFVREESSCNRFSEANVQFRKISVSDHLHWGQFFVETHEFSPGEIVHQVSWVYLYGIDHIGKPLVAIGTLMHTRSQHEAWRMAYTLKNMSRRIQGTLDREKTV